MTDKMGRYRYWGDQKPDTSRPLLTFSRPQEAVAAAARSGAAEQPAVTGTLRIYGPIDSYGGWWGVSAKEVAQALDLLGDAGRIIVRVNSPGGESSEGRAIVNLLRAHSAEIVTVVDGAAYSAASYIAACGDESVMSPGTSFMIHDTSTFFYGNEAAFRKTADVLGILSDSGAELYAEIAGGTVEEWRDRQRAETWYTASGVVEAGLMQRVGIVPDAGHAETAGDEPETVDPSAVEERARATYDLSLFEKAPAASNPKPPSASPRSGHPNTEGGTPVAFNDDQEAKIRELFDLPADADEAAVNAAIERVTEKVTAPETKPAETKIPEGMALVDNTVLAQLKQGAAAGQAAAATLAEQERDSVIGQALKDGKIAVTSREHFVTSWDKNPDATRSLIAALTPGLVPTVEVGHGDDTEDGDAAFEAAHAAFLAKHGLSKEV